MASIYYKAVPNVSGLEFSAVIPNKRGSSSVYITYQGTRISLQGIEVDGLLYSAPFGISSFVDDDPALMRKNLEMTINCPKALKFWQDIDAKVIETAIAEKDKWFRVPQSPEQIRRNYRPLVVLDENGKGYLPRLHTKVTVGGDAKDRLRVFNFSPSKNTLSPGTVQDLTAKSNGVPIIDLGSIFFMGASKFGLTLYTTDFLLFPSKTRGVLDHSFAEGMQIPKLNEKEIISDERVLVQSVSQLLETFDELTVSEPVKTKQKSTAVYLNSKDGNGIRFELMPVQYNAGLRIPFGIKTFQDEASLRPDMHVEIADPALVSLLQQIDQKILDLAVKNCETWFKRVSADDIAVMYRPMVNSSPASSYPPFLTCKIDLRPDARVPFKCMMYDHGSNSLLTVDPVTKATVPPASKGFPIISFGGIWFVGGRFGITLNIDDFIITSVGAGSPNGSVFDFGTREAPTFTSGEYLDQYSENFLSNPDNNPQCLEMPPLEPGDNATASRLIAEDILSRLSTSSESSVCALAEQSIPKRIRVN